MNIQEKTPVKSDKIQAVLGAEETAWSGRMESRRFVWIGMVVLAAAIAFVLWGQGASGPPTRYKTEPALRADLTVTVAATGTVEPTNDVEISSELSGKMARVFVDHNDKIEVGQVLAELDTDKLKADVAHARATLAVKKAKIAENKATVVEKELEYKRADELARKKITSRKTLETAKAASERATAALASARANVEVAGVDLSLKEITLKKAYIRSPIEGVVLKRNVDPGQIVASSFQAPILFTLAQDIRQMQLEVDIDEADISLVREGQDGTFSVDAYLNRKFPAKISELRYAPETVEGVVTFKAVLSIDNSKLLLRPGMTATAEIIVQHVKDTLLVSNAVLRYVPPANNTKRSRGFNLMKYILPGQRRKKATKSKQASTGERKLWVLEEQGPVAIFVKTGASDGTRTQILGGDIEAGDKLITGILALKD